jgi:hypothetical protein
MPPFATLGYSTHTKNRQSEIHQEKSVKDAIRSNESDDVENSGKENRFDAALIGDLQCLIVRASHVVNVEVLQLP